MIPRRYVLIGGVVIVLAAGIAWWLRPVRTEVTHSAHARVGPSEPPAAQAGPARIPVQQAPPESAPSASVGTPPESPWPDGWKEGLRIGDRMRARMEKDYERYYEDLGPALDLDQDERFALIRTLVEHRIQLLELAPIVDNRVATIEEARELLASQREDLRSLIGPRKLALLDTYQESLGAREEVLVLTRMAFPDQPISEEQRRRFIRAAIDASAYFDEPTIPSEDPWHVVQQQTLAKMEQRDAKMLDVARRVLGEQYVAAIQSFQMTRRESIESTLRPVPD